MTQLFVGNLSFTATEEQLRDLFSRHGRVSSVRIKTDRSTGRPRGFAFVTMSSDEDSEEAIARLSGLNFLGRPLVVNEADSGPGTSGANEAARKRTQALFDSL